MGNRAVITTEAKDLGVYLHWNGGRASVEAFLLYCKLKGYRCPENDCYGWARLCQVISNFFGGGLSVGIDKYEKLDTDNGDNGVYIIKDWQIVGKEFGELEELDTEYMAEVLLDINSMQPLSEQFDVEKLNEEFKNFIKTTITPRQIKAIHAIIKKLRWDDVRYRALLMSLFQKSTCKDLTEEEAGVLIEMLNRL